MQDEIVRGADGLTPTRVLDLGVGTGVTSGRLAEVFPDVQLVGIDESDAMLEHARSALPDADFRVSRIEDPLPDGPFDLVFSALAVHHLDGTGKADLFRRVADVLSPAGRFVLGDVIVPEDPADVVAPIDGVYDKPDTIADQLRWLTEAGFDARVTWVDRDLAVFVSGECARGHAP